MCIASVAALTMIRSCSRELAANGATPTYWLANRRAHKSRRCHGQGSTSFRFSFDFATNPHVVVLRNMVPDASFIYAASNVPKGSSPAITESIMGPYYPRLEYCTMNRLQSLGSDACALPLPDLTVSKTRTGNFSQGQVGARYVVTVSNTGAGEKQAGSLVSVTETAPSGLTLTAMSGTGWTCVTLPVCSRSDALAAGLSYSAITVTLTVAANATSPQVSTVSVATVAGESNTTNNSATDSVVIGAGTQGSLSVTRSGSRTGTVASIDGGINCGISCSHAYVNSSNIALIAAPATGSVFTGWLSGACTGTGACVVTVNGASSVSATFAPSTVGARIVDVDTNAQTDAPTDGLMILRYLFGMTGTAVTTGALGLLPGRSDPALIGTYLNDIRPYLDIDGNGFVDALTDGLLLLRALFGLTGSALTQGAIGPAAIRTTPTQITDQVLILKL